MDYTGPLRYWATNKREGKAYVLLYACSLTRGLFLVLLPSQETSEFLNSLKTFIACWGHPEEIYSNNGQTYVEGAKWIKTVMALDGAPGCGSGAQ